MIDNLHSRRQSIQRQFTIVWVIFTLFLLLIAEYAEWQQLKSDYHRQMTDTAENLASNLDELLERTIKQSEQLTTGNQAIETCPQTLISQLQSFVFDHPSVSGIVISDNKNKILCTTTTQETSLPPPAKHSPSLVGPLHPERGDKAVYFVQRQLGENYYGAFILSKVLEKALATQTPLRTIALYDAQSKKIIFQMGIHLPTLELPTIIKKPLQFHTQLSLVLVPHTLHFSKVFILKETVILVGFFILSALFYAYIRDLLNKRFSLKAALQVAIRKNQFKPVYQPTWNEKTKQYSSAEVLIRWQLNSKEVLYPNSFITEAEESGLIVPMTLQLIEKSFKDCQSLIKANKFSLSFNLSIQHFIDPGFFSTFDKLMHHYKIPPERVMLELTERELFPENDKQLISQLHALKNKGHALAVDDFGTGHASISYLQHFPFTHLKIDQSFVQSIGTGAITETLNQAIIQLATSLNLILIAEGVETEIQYQYLKEQNVNYIQGWYFSKAIDAKSLDLLVNPSKEIQDEKLSP